MKIGTLAPYKGYYGTLEYSGDDNVYFGRIKVPHNLYIYSSKTVEGLYEKFKKTVDRMIEIEQKRA